MIVIGLHRGVLDGRIAAFPLFPKLPEESEMDRMERSLARARETGVAFGIGEGTFEVLLRRILRARLDSSLLPSDDMLWLTPGYERFSENVYSTVACAEVCFVLRAAAEDMTRLADDRHVFIDEDGKVMGSRGISDEVVAQPLRPSEAARDCLLIADCLEKVVASAEGQGALVAFGSA